MNNDTPKTIKIPLSKRGKHKGKFETVIDAIDADLAELNWQVNQNTLTRMYAERSIIRNGIDTTISLHRIVMRRVLERDFKKGERIDHIDGNGLNNCRSNLRVCTDAQNFRNRGKQVNNRSGYKGVSWDKKSNKWKAQIQHNKQKYHLGFYDNPEDAHKAYQEKAKELHGEFARFD